MPAFAFAIGVAAFVAVAIIKPWGAPSGGAATAEPTTAVRAAAPSPPAADASEVLVAAAGTSCVSSDRQQLVVFERWPGHEVRSWIAVPDVAASGPLDPMLVPTDVFAAHATAIGVCAASVTGAPAGVHAASLLDVRVAIAARNGGEPIDAGRPNELESGGIGPDPVRLFGPPPAATADFAVPPSSAPTTSPDAPASARLGPGSVAAAGPAGRGDRDAASPAATWSLGTYTIAFRFPSDPPDARHWLRFALLRGGGDG